MNLFRRKVFPAIKGACGTKLNEIPTALAASLKMPDNVT